jgi:hypothetical protein
MLTVRKLILAALVLAALPWSAAHAGGFVGVSIGFPIGGCYHHYPYCGGYYYYRPYPAVYAVPAPVYVQPPLVEAVPAQPVYSAPAAVTAPPPASTLTLAPVPATTVRAAAGDGRQSDIENCLAHMANPDEKVRADMALQLGRMHALRAVDSLNSTLAKDPSPAVRDATARALGLIGSNASLVALDRAAQEDNDRDVRRSAQYAAEVIRANHGR